MVFKDITHEYNHKETTLFSNMKIVTVNCHVETFKTSILIEMCLVVPSSPKWTITQSGKQYGKSQCFSDLKLTEEYLSWRGILMGRISSREVEETVISNCINLESIDFRCRGRCLNTCLGLNSLFWYLGIEPIRIFLYFGLGSCIYT